MQTYRLVCCQIYHGAQFNYYVPLFLPDIKPESYFRQLTSGSFTDVIHAKWSVVFLQATNGRAVLSNGCLPEQVVTDAKGNTIKFAIQTSYSQNRVEIRVYDAEIYSNGNGYIQTRFYAFARKGNSWSRLSSVRGSYPNYPLTYHPEFAEYANPPVKGAPLPRINMQWVTASYDGVPSPNVYFALGEVGHAFGRGWTYPEVMLGKFQDLYVAAWDQLASLNENQFQNIAGAIEFVSSIINGRIADMAVDLADYIRRAHDVMRSLQHKRYYRYVRRILSIYIRDAARGGSDVWLKYRYVYSTGKMDFDQAMSWLNRQATYYGGWMRFDANGALDLGSGIQPNLHLEFFAMLDKHDLATYIGNIAWTSGLEINPYVVWDFIPFSFVADWFFNIGDQLQLQNDLKHWSRDFVTKNILWSIKYLRFVSHGIVELYYRFYAPFPVMDGYTYHESGISASVAVKRTADTISLVLGGA